SMGGMTAARLSCRTICVLVGFVSTGCATTRIDPGLYQAKTVAIASVFARKTIEFDNMPVAPMLYDNDFGAEVLEMELGETEGRLSELFGVDVVPAGKAMEARKAYDALPEVQPADEYTRVNDMTAVDLDSPALASSLGELAAALRVDAVVVLSHEWTL